MRNFPPNMAPFDVSAPTPRRNRFQVPGPLVSLLRSTHITPNDYGDPTLKMRRENLTGDIPHVDDPEWDFMKRMELLDP